MKICYSIPCKNVPHGELYVMCEPSEWPERKRQIILDDPKSFRFGVADVNRVPMLGHPAVVKRRSPDRGP